MPSEIKIVFTFPKMSLKIGFEKVRINSCCRDMVHCSEIPGKVINLIFVLRKKLKNVQA